MPNHFTTRVTVNGSPEDLMAFKNKHFVVESVAPDGAETMMFDFNTIIPMPPLLKETESSSTVAEGLMILGRNDVPTHFGIKCDLNAYLEYRWVKEAGVTTIEELKKFLVKRSPDCIPKAQAAIQAYEATGFTSWYDWSVEHWGTKWNSYNLNVTVDQPRRLTFKIDTAWAPPVPILEKLRELYPSLTFTFAGHDEGECNWQEVA